MSRMIFAAWIMLLIVCPVGALEIEAPAVPESAQDWMPDSTDTFADALLDLLQTALLHLRPDLKEAAAVCTQVFSAALLAAVGKTLSPKASQTVELAGTVCTALILMSGTNSMIALAADTIRELSDYGKLLYPVMTTALAAQGGVTTSTALYLGTAVFDTLLAGLISHGLIPVVFVYLILALGNSAGGEEILRKCADLIKGLLSWIMKTVLTVFTTYMGITGVISGSTDAAVLKAAKVTISAAVPVVGGILSDTSEAILVSAGLVRNAAGVYGILALLAIFLEPFVKIGSHYLLLKATGAVCGIFAPKSISGLIADFSAAMGLLLAMTGSVCLLFLISTACFMKGVG